jgi:hypothetical protein
MSARRIVSFVAVAVAAAALVAHSLVFNFVTDDAFISFVYSRNLAEHGQLVFNLGERVEGYTNFLWTLLLAGLLKIGLAPELMSRVLGTAAAIATQVTCAFTSRRLRGGGEWSPWDALPALVLAGVPGFACWASGGLETALFTFLVTLGMTRYLAEHLDGGDPTWSSLAFALAALTRPEGILFFALTVGHRGLAKLARDQLRPSLAELKWVGWFLLLVGPHLIWRRWYYGWWLPNTFYIKSSGGAGTWAQGGYYLMRFVEQLHLWVVPPLVALGLALRRERAAWALVGYGGLVTAVFVVYVASVGGDFMGLFRFALPIVPLVVIAAANGLRQALATVGRIPAAVVVLLLLGGHTAHGRLISERSLIIGADRGIDSPGFLRWYTADRAAIGKWFGKHALPDDYAAVGGAGAQVWYSGMRSLDCYGLSDAHIAHEVKPVSNRPGHQKYAPLEYQLSKQPTIITSNYYKLAKYDPTPGDFAFWHARGYRWVSVEVEGLSSRWYTYLLREDRPLPVEREP